MRRRISRNTSLTFRKGDRRQPSATSRLSRKALVRLATTPEVGAPRAFTNPRLTGIRIWPVPGFKAYLIFYRIDDDAVRVLRVLHAKRDIPGILEGEP
jgi:plasmid stabilization system protein ParE